MIPTLSKVVLLPPFLPTVQNYLNENRFSTLLALHGLAKIAIYPVINNVTTSYIISETFILYEKYFGKFGFLDKEGYLRKQSLNISEQNFWTFSLSEMTPGFRVFSFVAFFVACLYQYSWLYGGMLDVAEGIDLIDNSTRRNMFETLGVKIDDIDQAPDQ